MSYGIEFAEDRPHIRSRVWQFQGWRYKWFLKESETNPYPLRVRKAKSLSFATANDDEPGNPNKPKLLTIYELPDDNESRPRRRYRGRTRMKNWTPPAFKVRLWKYPIIVIKPKYIFINCIWRKMHR